MVTCPICTSVRVVIVLNGDRKAFCGACGATWEQDGARQARVIARPDTEPRVAGHA